MSAPLNIPFTVVIPARYGASRLPGKPLADIAGRAMVLRVLDVARASGAEAVLVATDDARIAKVVTADGGTPVMTAPDCASGTDRLAAVAAQMDWPDDRLVVNLQGDEPRLPPAALDLAARTLAADTGAALATLACPFTDPQAFASPHQVKLVMDAQHRALYFSRAAIPYRRDASAPFAALRHIGLYAYRVRTLKTLAALPPAPLELAEGLEQLRALTAGMKIAIALLNAPPPPGVDTLEDLTAMQRHFAGG